MHKTNEQLSTTNGVLSTFVVLLISTGLTGCLTTPYQPARSPVVLTEYDLNYFQIDCKNKKEQVELLQGQRRTKTDVINSWYKVPFNGFQPVLSERRNWLVDYHLTDLRNLCYD
jgi:hypothetical protein